MRDDTRVADFRMRWPGAVGCAVASGLLALAAFPPYDLWWCAPLAVALLTVAIVGQRPSLAALLGLVHGLALFVPMLRWTGIFVGAWPWLLLASVQALYLAAMGWATAVWIRSVIGSRWVSTALPLGVGALWVAQEAVRSRYPFGGFPWGRLAFSQKDGPTLWLAALGGAPLVTGAVAVLGAAITMVVIRMRRESAAGQLRGVLPIAKRCWAAALPLVVAATAVAVAIPAARWQPGVRPAGDSLRIAVVQGNVPRAGLEFNAQRRAVLDNHVAATVRLARQVDNGDAKQPDMVIWPENSSDIDPLKYADAAAAIDEAATAIGVPILVGAVLDASPNTLANAGLVWEPGKGVTDKYVKRHPVPFAEYMPFRGLLRNLTSKVDLVRKDFEPGDGQGTVQAGEITLGDIICFEVAYDQLVADTVNNGAELLVVQTNNATFGRSSESVQQLAMVQLRAVEHGRYAAMASTSGISAIVTPSGRVSHATELFTQRVLVAEITLSGTRTVATKIGPLPEWLFVTLAAGGVLFGLLASRRQRAQRNSSQETATSVRPAQSAVQESVGAREPSGQRSGAAPTDDLGRADV